MNWDIANIAQTEAYLWAKLAVPTAGGRLTLNEDGEPDADANPNRMLISPTTEGSNFLIRPGYEQYFIDEDPAPIKKSVSEVEAAIAASLVNVSDMRLVELLLPGVGTYDAGVGYEEVSIGRRPIEYTSVALIYPLESDPELRGVMHLYKASNDEGIAAEFGRRKLSAFPVAFRGATVPSRAQIDRIGKYFKQVPIEEVGS